MSTEQDLLQGMGAIADSPWIQEELTPSGELSVGGYALGVTDVVISLVSGANVNPNDLASSASSMVCNLVCDLVSSLFSSCASVVPFVGALFDGVMGLLKGLQEEQEAEERRKAAEREAKCKARAAMFATLGTGPWSQVLPADYFVRATRDPNQQWTVLGPAFVGQFLEMVLTESWPRWFVDGYNRKASKREWMRLMGADVIPDAEAVAGSPLFRTPVGEAVWGQLHQSEVGPQGQFRYADTRNYPADCAEKRIALQVARGIAGQHPAVLWQQGRPLGEAGREAWPLFCDLLYMLCRMPRPPWWADGVPWTDAEAAALGLRPVPTLQEQVIRSLYSHPAADKIDSAVNCYTEWNRIATTEVPTLRQRAHPFDECNGSGHSGCNHLYGIADGWRYFAIPATQSDADYRDQQIRDAWKWMWEQTGGTSKLAGRVHAEISSAAHMPSGRAPLARDRARKAIEVVASELGWSEAAKRETNAILEAENQITAQRVKAATTSVAVGVGAAGALGLAYLWSR